jgi:hypothetical protein
MKEMTMTSCVMLDEQIKVRNKPRGTLTIVLDLEGRRRRKLRRDVIVRRGT